MQMWWQKPDFKKAVMRKIQDRSLKIWHSWMAVVAMMLVSTTSHAAILIGWNVNGVELDAAGWSAPFTYDGITSTGIAGGSLTLGSGVNPSTTVNQYGFKVTAANKQTTLAGAISNQHYIQFTITAATGYVFHLESLMLFGQSSGDGANNVALLSSIAGFEVGKEIALVNDIAGATGGFDSDDSGFGPITFGGPEYQNLTSVTFRLYGWNTNSGSGVTYIRDLVNESLGGMDLVVNGTAVPVDVPEPNRMLLIGFAVAGGLVLRRCR